MRVTTRLVCSSIVLTLTLGNLAVSSKAQSSPVAGRNGSGSVPSKAWIPISAFYDIPPVNADVAVYNTEGKLLLKKQHGARRRIYSMSRPAVP